MFLLRAEEVP